MRTLTRLLSLSALLLTFALGPAAGQETTRLKSISYADLGKLVRSHKGKAIVVYVWHFT